MELQNEITDLSPLILDYVECDSKPSLQKPNTSVTTLDLSPESPHADILVHQFASHGPKARPIHVDVNGRKGRRAVCVLYGDSMRYEVLDLDAAMEEDEGEDEDEEDEEEEEEEEEGEDQLSDDENDEN